MTWFERSAYPDFRPLLISPAQGCSDCPARPVCAHLQAEEEVLCELTDREAGVDPDAAPLDNWLNKVRETPTNRRGLTWWDEGAAAD